MTEPRRTTVNGIDVAYLEAGPADGPLALCLHGFPEHAWSWRFQAPVLVDLGYEVWAPNLRGYGRSSRPGKIKDYHIDQLLADVAGLIDASGAKETVLIAHDWGAIIAWMFATAAASEMGWEV